MAGTYHLPLGYSDAMAARIAHLPHLSQAREASLTADEIAALLESLVKRSRELPPFVEK